MSTGGMESSYWLVGGDSCMVDRGHGDRGLEKG
jgi:hypothetical protein